MIDRVPRCENRKPWRSYLRRSKWPTSGPCRKDRPPPGPLRRPPGSLRGPGVDLAAIGHTKSLLFKSVSKNIVGRVAERRMDVYWAGPGKSTSRFQVYS